MIGRGEIMTGASCFSYIFDAKIADRGSALQEWAGTVSNNALFIKILCEHIHNDIYLLKLKERYGKEIYHSSLRLNTDFERRQKERIENEHNRIRLN